MPFCLGSHLMGNIKGRANYSRPLFASSLASSRTGQSTWESTFSLFAFSLASSRTDHLSPSHHTKHYEESTSNLWTIGVWEIILSSFIFSSKPTDPRRNKLDFFQLLRWLQYFNSCPDDSISTPVLTSAFQFLSWQQPLNSCFDFSVLIPALSFTTVPFFLRLTAQDFLSSQAVNKTSKLKSINIFTNSFVLPFNITRGNRTLQHQLPFLYKW